MSDLSMNLNNKNIRPKWHSTKRVYQDAGDIEEELDYIFRTVGTNFANKDMALRAAKESNSKIEMISQANGEIVISASANTFAMLYEIWTNLAQSVTIEFKGENE